ncbi:MAG: hypothetical protein K6G12_05810 [Lachnospiraceae bacterium]|nr:hypothetical protein [Lachnospiraceae bacterium]
MDGFSDRLSQHFSSSQEMINANSQAEATEAEKLKSEVNRLMTTLQELETKMSSMGQGGAAEVDISGISDQLGGLSEKLENHIHKENVRVYRNVQASLVDELGKQSEQVNEKLGEQLSSNNKQILDELTEKTDMLSAMLETLNEQQKSQGQAVSGMASQLNNMEESVKKSIRNRALLPLQIIMFVIVLGELVINIMLTLGYL